MSYMESKMSEALDGSNNNYAQMCEQIATLQLRNEELEKALQAVQCLMDDSDGVYGLHLNGDLSPWDELLEGGYYEDWLINFSKALNRNQEVGS